jgi:hypothetical protein
LQGDTESHALGGQPLRGWSVARDRPTPGRGGRLHALPVAVIESLAPVSPPSVPAVEAPALPASSTLVRLLAQLDAAPAPVAREPFARHLARWVEWRDAIALSTVLNSSVDRSGEARADEVRHEARRVRTALDAFIQATGAARPRRRDARPGEVIEEPAPDFAALNQQYVAAQREMAARIGALRARVREALQACCAESARLAALDAVMEGVVAEREHLLLAGVPRRLQPRFGQCGLPDFVRDLQTTLRAELALRWQPIDALLEALAPRTTPNA